MPVRSKYVKPFGIEQVNLVDIFFQRRVASGVPRDVKSASYAFILVQDNLRGSDIRFTVIASTDRMLLLFLLESVIWLLLFARENGRNIRATHDRHDKEHDEDREQYPSNVEDSADAFPAFALRIEKTGLDMGHWGNYYATGAWVVSQCNDRVSCNPT